MEKTVWFRSGTGLLLLLMCLWGGCSPSKNTEVEQFAVDLSSSTEILLDGVAEITELELGVNGNLYVLDAKNNQVHIYQPDGEHILSFGSAGSGPGEFRNPRSIEVERESIFVAERGGTVHKFTANGDFVAQIKPSTIFHMNSSFHVVESKIIVGGLKEEVGGFGSMLHVFDFQDGDTSVDFASVPPLAVEFNATMIFGINCDVGTEEAYLLCVQPTDYALFSYSIAGDSISYTPIEDPEFRRLSQLQPIPLNEKMEWISSFDQAYILRILGRGKVLIEVSRGPAPRNYSIVEIKSGRTTGRLQSGKRILAIDRENKRVVLEGDASESKTAVNIIYSNAPAWIP